MHSYGHVSPDAPVVKRSTRARTWIRTWVLERTLRHVPRTDRVLDLCCGYGFYFSINPDAHGIDGDPQCVKVLQDEGRSVVLANVLERLPYDDGSFEQVLAHDVLEHFVLEELQLLFPEVHRVLQASGTFLVWVPNLKGYRHGLNPAVGHRLYVTAETIQQLADGLFEVVRHYPEPLPRSIGKWFSHNKEVFHLRKAA